MTSTRHRFSALFPLALLIAAAGCTSADDEVRVPVPHPGAEVTKLCQNLDKALPDTVDGLGRHDPVPASPLTAAWGSSAIILRCGIPRPAVMSDPEALPAEVNGVGWVVEKRHDGSYRFTTALRRAYVEVTITPDMARENGSGMLVDFANPVKKTIPKGIAD